MPELLIIDLSSVYHPIYHSTPPSEPASAPHDATVRKVRNLAERFLHVAVCVDARRNWRRDLAPTYKAQREERPEEMFVQLARVVETLKRDGFAVYEADGYEADDLIATLVEQAQRDPAIMRVLVATDDKDLAQLVSSFVSCLPVRRAKDGTDRPLLTPEGVTEKFGVMPSQIGDFLALTGDATDNIAGIPSVGPKRAAQILTMYGSLDRALEIAHAEDVDETEMKPQLRALLVEHAATARLARQLVDLRRDAPIDLAVALQPRIAKPLRAPSDTTALDEERNDPEEIPMQNVTDADFEHVNEQPKEPAKEPPAPTPIQSAPVKPAETTAMVRAEVGTDAWAMALEPQTIRGADWLATQLFNSRLFGGFTTPEGVLAAIMLGRSLGIPSLTIVRNCHVIKGKLTLHVDLLVGLVKKSPICEYFYCVESTRDRAVYETKRRGDPAPVRHTYELQDAIDARLVPRDGKLEDSTWGKHRRTMLRHGCERELVRMVYQDLTAGLYTPDELNEIEDAKPRAA